MKQLSIEELKRRAMTIVQMYNCDILYTNVYEAISGACKALDNNSARDYASQLLAGCVDREAIIDLILKIREELCEFKI